MSMKNKMNLLITRDRIWLSLMMSKIYWEKHDKVMKLIIPNKKGN